MKLSDLRSPDGARYKAKRVGRGHGSGRMKTSGRGQKGQKARTGSAIPAYFEGGQNRFSQRMPYLSGFKNHFRKEYVVVNLRDLTAFKAGDEVTTAALVEKGMIRLSQASEMLKVLGEGALDRALKVTAHKVSDSARKQIEAAGGSVTLIEMRTYPKTKRSKTPRETEATNQAASAPAATATQE
jgi:large subunit ribosomal protein L15